jgi:hypothetical protein
MPDCQGADKSPISPITRVTSIRPRVSGDERLNLARLRSDAHFAVASMPRVRWGQWHSENPKVPNFSDGWRPAEDEVGDVLGQERAGNVTGNPFY